MPMLPPRRLTFAVGTSLLTASLVSAGCSKNHTVNVKPDEPPHVNEGPAPEEPASDSSETDGPEQPDAPEPAPEPDGPNVNTRAPE